MEKHTAQSIHGNNSTLAIPQQNHRRIRTALGVPVDMVREVGDAARHANRPDGVLLVVDDAEVVALRDPGLDRHHRRVQQPVAVRVRRPVPAAHHHVRAVRRAARERAARLEQRVGEVVGRGVGGERAAEGEGEESAEEEGGKLHGFGCVGLLCGVVVRCCAAVLFSKSVGCRLRRLWCVLSESECFGFEITWCRVELGLNE